MAEQSQEWPDIWVESKVSANQTGRPTGHWDRDRQSGKRREAERDREGEGAKTDR